MSLEALSRLQERLREDVALRALFASSPLEALQGYDLTHEEQRQLILPNFSWLIERRLAGSSRPRNRDAVALLAEQGARSVVSLSEQPLPADLVTVFDLLVEHVPIADFAAPTLAQVEQAVGAIDRFEAMGRPTVVHCGAGLGRTGTMLACALVAHGASAQDAIARVRAARPGSIETPEQVAIVEQYQRSREARDQGQRAR